jgi:hypothetical protein
MRDISLGHPSSGSSRDGVELERGALKAEDLAVVSPNLFMCAGIGAESAYLRVEPTPGQNVMHAIANFGPIF